VTKRYVNLGIAVAGPRGLVVPNVKDAHQLHFRDLATELATLTEQARAARSTPADLTGGTITITNVGVFGVDAGVPLLNPGEAAILALGAVQRRPWEHHGEVALRDVVTLSLAFDHRLVDGEGASRFLRAVGEILADPTNLIAFS
jgi:pyruvate dehydrogenase E2 component (dihydrolipoamide acetyltransferase)